jgi:hypothetical protein
VNVQLLLFVSQTLISQSSSTIVVQGTGWVSPADIDFVWDSTTTAETTFADFAHSITPTQAMRWLDRACVVWARAAGTVVAQCRSGDVADVVPLLVEDNSMFNDQEFIGWNADGLSAAFFHDTQRGVLGDTWCGFPYLEAQHCDFYLRAWDSWETYSEPWSTFPGSSLMADGLTYVTVGEMNGGANTRESLYDVVLHEVGHALGLFHGWHEFSDGTDAPCDPSTYFCPVMAGSGVDFSNGTTGPPGGGWRTVYWPTSDDVIGLRNKHVPVPISGRKVQWATFRLASDGKLLQASNWVEFAPVVRSVLPPRVACRPTDSNAGGACVMVTSGPATEPVFRTIQTQTTLPAAATTLHTARTKIDGPIDIAVGEAGGVVRYLALGTSPVYTSTKHNLVVFVGTMGAEPTSWIMANSMRSHTEPRVTFMESGPGWFVGVWPEDEAIVRVAVFDMNGNRVSHAFLQDDNDSYPSDGPFLVRTVFPAEVSCDNHLDGVSNFCDIYVDPLSTATSATSSNFVGGEKARYRIEINPSTGAIQGATGGFVSSPRWATTGHARSLLVDTATYGNGRKTGDYNANAWLIVQDNFRDLSPNEAVYTVDNNAQFATPHLSLTTENMIDDQPNVTSWDWNEHLGRFFAIRLGGNLP